MRKETFEDVLALFQRMSEQQSRGLNVSAILFDEEVELFMRLALANPDLEISIIEYENPMCDYGREYVVSLAADDFFSVEKLYRDGHYLNVDADAVYIDGRASSLLIPSDTLERKRWTEIDFAIETYITKDEIANAWRGLDEDINELEFCEECEEKYNCEEYQNTKAIDAILKNVGVECDEDGTILNVFVNSRAMKQELGGIEVIIED